MNAGSPKDRWRGLALPVWERVPVDSPAPLLLGNCDPAAEAYLIAALLKAQEEKKGRVWVFTPHARRRDQLAEEFAFWKCPALVLPEPTVVIEQELTDPDREAERVSTLHRIAQSPETPVVLSRSSWEAPAPELGAIIETELKLAVGQEIEPDELIAWLEERSYEEHPQIFNEDSSHDGAEFSISSHRKWPDQFGWSSLAMRSSLSASLAWKHKPRLGS